MAEDQEFQWGFSGPVKPNDETNNANEHKVATNPNWWKGDQLSIYKHTASIKSNSKISS